jgi:hypothetical protein
MPPASANPSRNAVTRAAVYWDSNPLGRSCGPLVWIADPARQGVTVGLGHTPFTLVRIR